MLKGKSERSMGEEEGCRNRKSDMTSLGRKLELHILVYIIDVQFF
jgi:hypothetical protein